MAAPKHRRIKFRTIKTPTGRRFRLLAAAAPSGKAAPKKEG